MMCTPEVVFYSWFPCRQYHHHGGKQRKYWLPPKKLYTAFQPHGATGPPHHHNSSLNFLPVPPQGTFVLSYADDFTIFADGMDIDTLDGELFVFMNLLLALSIKVKQDITRRRRYLPPAGGETKAGHDDPQPPLMIDNKDEPKHPIVAYFDSIYEEAQKMRAKLDIFEAMNAGYWIRRDK